MKKILIRKEWGFAIGATEFGFRELNFESGTNFYMIFVIGLQTPFSKETFL